MLLLLVSIVLLPKNSIAIFGGTATTVDNMPWVVSYGGKHTGAILAEKWVITVASAGKLPFVKYASTFLDIRDGDIIMVDEHFRHPNFSKASSINDIQLLKLETNIKFNDKAQPILIGDESQIKAGTALKIAGWGQINLKDKASTALMSVSIMIAKTANCNATGPSFCAGGRNGACNGDLGAPGSVDDKLVGLFIKGHRQCEAGTNRGSYSNVPSVKKWISLAMRLNRGKRRPSKRTGSEVKCDHVDGKQ